MQGFSADDPGERRSLYPPSLPLSRLLLRIDTWISSWRSLPSINVFFFYGHFFSAFSFSHDPLLPTPSLFRTCLRSFLCPSSLSLAIDYPPFCPVNLYRIFPPFFANSHFPPPPPSSFASILFEPPSRSFVECSIHCFSFAPLESLEERHSCVCDLRASLGTLRDRMHAVSPSLPSLTSHYADSCATVATRADTTCAVHGYCAGTTNRRSTSESPALLSSPFDCTASLVTPNDLYRR